MKRPALLLTFLAGASALCAGLALFSEPSVAQEAPAPRAAEDRPSAGDDGSETKVRKLLSVGAAIDRVDIIIEEGWAARKLKPSAPADDLEWMRRVTLDLIGRVPTLEEVEELLVDESNGKRRDYVNGLLDSPEYAQYQAILLQRALINVGGQRVRDGLPQLNGYLEESLGENKPWDKMALEMVSFSGEVEDGRSADAGGYMLTMAQDVNNLTGNVARAFLGIEIQCVQCHDDNMVPVDEGGFYQKDFQQMAAIFSRTRAVRKSNDRSNMKDYQTWVIRDENYRKMNEQMVRRNEERIKNNPELKERFAISSVTPRALRGPEIDGQDGGELRTTFGQWMTDENPWFARTMVNRVWAHYMKRGFVEPVDDFSILNEPTNPELLKFLAEDFEANNYDLRRLTRIVVGTKAYQLSSKLAEGEKSANDRIYYSRAYMRQLGALETFNSLIASTQLEKTLERTRRRELGQERQRLLQSFTFGSDDDEDKASESFTGTIPQALMMMNGEFLNGAASVVPGSQLYTILKSYDSVDDRVRAMYLASLTREPSKADAKRMKNYIEKEGDGSVAAYEDVFWALLNSAEYLINH